MKALLRDASALVKRYGPGRGSEAASALFDAASPASAVLTVLGYAETYSALLRRMHAGTIRPETFRAAKALLRREILDEPDVVLPSVPDTAVFEGFALMERHHVNASDAAILSVYLTSAHSENGECILIASDQRLPRAAHAEGLDAVDPEGVIIEDALSCL